jgi:hypothetical protein
MSSRTVGPPEYENEIAQTAATASGSYDLDALLEKEALGISPFGASPPAESSSDAASDKAWTDLVQSKSWKERKVGYGALEALFAAPIQVCEGGASTMTEICTRATAILSTVAKEKMAGAQESCYRAIEACFTYPDYARMVVASEASTIAAALVVQGLASRSHRCAEKALLAMICSQSDNSDEHCVGKAMVKLGLKSKNTKLVGKSLSFVLRIVEDADVDRTCKDELHFVLGHSGALLSALDTHKLPDIRQMAKKTAQSSGERA